MGRILTALLVALVLALPAAAQQPIDVWLDVDPANGIGEIDDGLMMIQAFHSPEIKVHGVSITFGNAELKNAFPIGLNIARTFGPEGIGVYSGAASGEDFGKQTDAVRAMAEALRETRLTILAVGPVTNVGTLVKLHPELHERIDRIIVVAGRRPGQRFVSNPQQTRPFRDFNFELDPVAMQAILDTKIPLVMAPWEISSKVWVTRDDLQTLRERGGSGLYVFATSQHWIDNWERRLNAPGFNPFDTLALGYVTHPDLIEGVRVTVRIENGPDDQPGNEARTKPYLLVTEAADSGREALYLHTPKPGFKAMLLERLAETP